MQFFNFLFKGANNLNNNSVKVYCKSKYNLPLSVPLRMRKSLKQRNTMRAKDRNGDSQLNVVMVLLSDSKE